MHASWCSRRIAAYGKQNNKLHYIYYMKNLFEHINEYINEYINEHKVDLMPQCVIVMGGPGAGKTYWMNNNARKFFQNNIEFKKLDSDWNLKKFQREHMNELCVDLMNAILPNAVSDASTRKQAFYDALSQEQEKMNAAVGYGKISKELDIMELDYNFFKMWADRYDNAIDSKKQGVINDMKEAFYHKYFEDLFASDFSVRMLSKAEYKKHFQQKLKGEMEGIEFIGKQDVVVAITGDEIKKFEDIVAVCGDTHNVTVVYLNVPEEMSVRQDAERARSLGEKMVKQILASVHSTWEELKENYERIGITKLIEMTTPDPKAKHPSWRVSNEYINYSLLKTKG